MSVRGIFFDDRSQPKGAVQKARKDAGFFFKQSDHLSYLKASLRVLLRNDGLCSALWVTIVCCLQAFRAFQQQPAGRRRRNWFDALVKIVLLSLSSSDISVFHTLCVRTFFLSCRCRENFLHHDSLANAVQLRSQYATELVRAEFLPSVRKALDINSECNKYARAPRVRCWCHRWLVSHTSSRSNV